VSDGWLPDRPRFLGLTRRQINGLGAVACAGMIGFALFAQHILGLEPCPLCILQRVGTVSLGLVFLLAAVHDAGPAGARIWGVLLLLTAGVSASVSARHVWIQSLPPDQVPACGPGLDYLLDVFGLTEGLSMVFSGSGECAEVVWSLFGLSMPAWVLICFAVLGGVGLALNWRLAGRSAA
jgi:disulfide bond formation protein DsbB